jgi:hypothetical protein
VPKHSRSSRRSGLAAVIGLALLCVLLIAAWAVVTIRPGATDSTASAKPSLAQSKSTAPSAPSLRSCGAEVRAGELTLRAGQVAATHWRQHVGAQQKVDRGEITSAQAHAIWKASKAPGPEDLRRFDAASADYQSVRGGCATLAEGPTANDPDASACVTRAKLLGQAVDRAARVVTAWRQHQQMMLQQDHSTTAYLGRWARMVAAAPADLNALDAAAAKVTRAKPCPAAV